MSTLLSPPPPPHTHAWSTQLTWAHHSLHGSSLHTTQAPASCSSLPHRGILSPRSGSTILCWNTDTDMLSFCLDADVPYPASFWSSPRVEILLNLPGIQHSLLRHPSAETAPTCCHPAGPYLLVGTPTFLRPLNVFWTELLRNGIERKRTSYFLFVCLTYF